MFYFNARNGGLLIFHFDQRLSFHQVKGPIVWIFTLVARVMAVLVLVMN